MKRAKILLTAVAVVAVVSGAVAFKAHRAYTQSIFVDPDQEGNCQVLQTSATLGGNEVTTYASIDQGPCTTQFTTTDL